MKAKKWIIALTAVAVIAAFALSACGNKNEPAGGQGTPSGVAQPQTEAPSVAPVSGSTEYKLFAVGQDDTFYSAEEYSNFMSELMNGIAGSMGADDGTQEKIQDTLDFSDSSLLLRDDGTAELRMFGMGAECAWSENNGTLTLSVTAAQESESSTVSNGTEYKATIENGIVKLNDPQSGSVMVFAEDGADTSGIKISSMKDALSSLGN